MSAYDVLIIGSGAAGQTVATECAKAGKSVAVVDRLPFGGTCALRGCIPKKAMIAAVEAVSRTEGLRDRGIVGSCGVDWRALMSHKKSYTGTTPDRTTSWMHELGISTLSGTARFVSHDAVEVNSDVIRASDVVIATGSSPVELGIEGADLVQTSTDFLALEDMPGQIVFIGGGYVSFEFARLAQVAGAHVTIVHRSGTVLKGFDPELAGMLADRYRMLGVDIVLDVAAKRVERMDDGRLTLQTTGGAIAADMVFHGAGRLPDLLDLDLVTGGVDATTRGVTVDASLRSVSNARVWSAGDAAAVGAPLTPVAAAQGEIVAAGILGEPGVFDDSMTPSVVFSDPPLTRVGISVDEARGSDRYEVRVFDMSEWFTQTHVGNTAAGARVIVERESGTIAGAHLLGVEADEAINIFALAMRFGITLEDLREVTWSYPTLAYDINYLVGRY